MTQADGLGWTNGWPVGPEEPDAPMTFCVMTMRKSFTALGAQRKDSICRRLDIYQSLVRFGSSLIEFRKSVTR